MAVLVSKTKGPAATACDKKHKWIVTVVADAEGTSKKKASDSAEDQMKVKLKELDDAVRAKTCPQNCRPGDWGRRGGKESTFASKISATDEPHSSLRYRPPAPEALRPDPFFLNLPKLNGPHPRLQEALGLTQ